MGVITWIPNIGFEPDCLLALVALFIGTLADSETNFIIARVAVASYVDTLAGKLWRRE